MALPYDKALQEWGARKLQVKYPEIDIDRDSIRVSHEYNTGFGCNTCGTDVDSEIYIKGETTSGKLLYLYQDWDRDFGTFIREVVEAGEGTITSE